MERKQRIHFMLSPDVVKALEEIPAYQRSYYVEQLIRKDKHMQGVEPQQKGFAAYQRSIDYGAGVQTVYVNDGIITGQNISAREDLHHSYTGPGNPEWVGQPVTALRGIGFKRLRGRAAEIEEEQWIISEMQSE